MLTTALKVATDAARSAGKLLRESFNTPRTVNEYADHDIKLEMDVQCETIIAAKLRAAFPDHALLAEEGGESGDAGASGWQWVVDPIDGTVNYFHGIPHFCVSIALRQGTETRLGVIYDPMMDELWQATSELPTHLNGQPVRVTANTRPGDSIASIGISRISDADLDLIRLRAASYRKIRLMGSAALALAYVSCGRFDLYEESVLSLWDCAAGLYLVERAGGRISVEPSHVPGKLAVKAVNSGLPL